MICKMAASSLQEIVTEVANSLRYCLKTEQKKAILLFVDGKDVFVFLPTGHEVTTAYHTTKTLCKIRVQSHDSHRSMHTLHNN